MGQGNQSRALIMVSKAQGWDPTTIEGGESLANWDKDPRGQVHDPTGTLRRPDAVDGYDVNIGTPKVTWNAPKPSKGG